MIEMWFDGCCEPTNPGGHASSGTHIRRGEEVLFNDSFYLGSGSRMSNNVAEYTAFIRGLEFLIRNGLAGERIHVRGDSNLVIRQQFPDLDGSYWKMRGGLYIPYAVKAKKLLKQFTNITANWIPRDENDICDSLSKSPLLEKKIKFRIQPIK